MLGQPVSQVAVRVARVAFGFCYIWIVLAGAEDDKDQRKLAFTLQALESADPFIQEVTTPVDVLRALEWQAGRSPKQVMHEREQLISQLESAGAEMWCSGRCAE